ncbi:MAG: DUF6538 domain-containing protein [Paracoccaceae bacterium]
MGKSLGVTRRGDTFHLRKRVPARYRDIEGRDTVWISLHTDSESVAKSKADRAWSSELLICTSSPAAIRASASDMPPDL